MPRHDGHRVLPGERRFARQQLIEETPQAVDVGGGADLFAGRLLGRHVDGGPNGHAGLGQLLAAALTGRPRDAKVGHQGVTVGDQNVLRLDVAVNDVLRVGVSQSVGHFEDVLNGIVDRQLPVAVEPVPQRFTLDEGHDVKEETIGFTRVVEAKDVRVLELGGELDLALKPLGPDGGRELGVEDLDRDPAIVLDVAGKEDRGHSPATELALDGVPVR